MSEEPLWKTSIHDEQPEPAIGVFVVTDEWLRDHATAGRGWTRRQLEAIGVGWPPNTGWLQNMLGEVISLEQKAEFERAKRALNQDIFDYGRLIDCARGVLFGDYSTAKPKEVMKRVAREMKQQKPRNMEGKCLLLQAFLHGRGVAPPEGAVVKIAPLTAPAPQRQRTKTRQAGRRQKKSKGHWGHEFYDSREWLTLRYKAIKLYGRKCMACSTTEGEMHVDHIKPRSKYPELQLEISNLQVLCRACNLGKSAWDETDWRPTETEQ